MLMARDEPMTVEDAMDKARRQRQTFDLQWFVAHSGNPSDDRVRERITRGGHEFYYPMVERMRPVPKRELPPKWRNSIVPIMKPVAVPVFARYFFVRFSSDGEDWRKVFEDACVHGILCNSLGGRRLPAPFPDPFVIALKRLANPDGVIPSSVTVKQLAYEIGEQVRIKDGPFAGHNAVVDDLPDLPIGELDESAKLTLLIAGFGRTVPMELPVTSIEKL